ncbi:MAG: nicotinate-nicotinamide nucleotide adenylyltransferase [Armatimonadetes bacterium]|nr:nicotinate-nicotinamide nucleotide adenylyltransferase [Armatimonadota bacterium]
MEVAAEDSLAKYVGQFDQTEDSNGWQHIAVFGGTFDPPHAGHRWMVQTALDAFKFDKVLVRPCNGNPFKGAPVASLEQRIEMCELMFAGMARVEVDGHEREVVAPTYTYRTVFSLFMEERQPAYYHVLVGEDCLPNLGLWKNLSDLFLFADVYAIGPNVEAKRAKLPPWIRRHVGYAQVSDKLDFHAVDLRAQMAKGQFDDKCISPRVIDYIKARGLYCP